MNDETKPVGTRPFSFPMESGRKVRTAVIGLGHWGPNLVRAIERHSRAEVVVAADQSAERRALIAQKIPNLPLESSLTDCLEKHDFDAVFVAVPTELHYQIGMRVLQAGKHLFMAKRLLNCVRKLIVEIFS